MSITRCILRWGLVSGLALGGVTLLVGPERVSAGLSMIRSKAQGVVDGAISDPIALRHQLKGLAEQYPERIAQVEGELAQVDSQLSTFKHDMQVSNGVVALTTSDLGKLKALVARAETSGKDTNRPVALRFDGVKYNLDEAYNEARRLNTVRATYQDRLANEQQQIQFLTEQKARLQDIAGKLHSESDTFNAQMWELDRQIDSIDRNNRLIEITKQHQATLANYEKFGKVGNLKQIEGKLAELRAVQKAQLDALSKQGTHTDYERRAEMQLNSSGVNGDPFADVPEQPADETNQPTDNGAEKSKDGAKKFAFADPIVIE